MAFGFHLVGTENFSAEDLLRKVDEAAGVLNFSSRASVEHGRQRRFYRRGDRQPELSVAFDFQPARYEISMFPLEEKEVLAYSPEGLVKIWSSLGTTLHAALGRTFLDIGFGTIQTAETEGVLKFIDWYQYFSERIVNRWGLKYLQGGPFYRVQEYANGACGVWLAASPFERLGRLKAAEYLGVQLPRLYGKNPKTGKPMEIPWS